MDIALLRELIDASTRPGQPGASLWLERLPSGQLLTGSRPIGASRYDWSTGTTLHSALYGRARYGSHRYLGR